jgi:hypothetical protein
MAGIVPSLFGPTPEELMSLKRREEAQAIQQAGATLGPRGAAGAAFGTALGRGANALFGLEDPAIKQATDVYATIQRVQQELGTDVKDPTILYPALAKGFADAGLPEMANKVMLEGYDKMGDYQKQQADIYLTTEKAKGELYKAKKEKKSSLELAEDYLVETQTALDTALAGGMDPNDPSIAKLTAVRDRAKTAVDAAGQEKVSTDALISKAIQIKANPKSSAADKEWANTITAEAAPFKQGPALAGKVWDSARQTYVDLPGSKADVEAVKAEKAKIKGLFTSINSSINVKEVIGDALKLIRPDTVGIYAYGVGPIPGKLAIAGSDTFNLQKAIKTIQAELGFDKLQAIRDASKTGGALGNVSNKEIEFLQSSVRSLDIGQSDEILRKNIQKIYESYNRLQASLEEDLKETQEAQASRPQNKPASTGGNLVDMLGIELKKRNSP